MQTNSWCMQSYRYDQQKRIPTCSSLVSSSLVSLLLAKSLLLCFSLLIREPATQHATVVKPQSPEQNRMPRPSLSYKAHLSSANQHFSRDTTSDGAKAAVHGPTQWLELTVSIRQVEPYRCVGDKVDLDRLADAKRPKCFWKDIVKCKLNFESWISNLCVSSLPLL